MALLLAKNHKDQDSKYLIINKLRLRVLVANKECIAG
jgi:hypothetical protein